MTIQYEKFTSEFGTEFIKRTNADNSVTFIPCDPANSDYQRYLNPEAKQSTPIVKDEPAAKK
jgi:hypothetical protein